MVLSFDLKKLRFKIVDKMRFDDPGDFYDNKIIVYSGVENEVYRRAVALHEFFEAMALDLYEVKPFQIDEWDKLPRNKRPKIYQDAHRYALKAERLFIKFLGQDWKTYDDFIKKIKVKVI
jgi:hypothetical protein